MLNNDYNTWYLSCSLSHMSNCSNIDKRAFNIILHINDKSCWQSLSCDIHDLLKTLLSKSKKKIPLKYTPSIISSLDFEGSKKGIISNKSPHIHILAVLGQPLAESQLTDVIKKLNEFLIKHPNLNRTFKNPIVIDVFKIKTNASLRDQYLNIIDYNRKSRLGNDSEVLVLPYQDIIISDNDLFEKIKKVLLERTKSITKDLNDNSQLHKYFSKAV